MRPQDCEVVIDWVVQDMNRELHSEINLDRYRKAKGFQIYFLERIQSVCKEHGFTAEEPRYQQGFPDLKLNGCGVEVKHTLSDTWKQNGNSVINSLRDPEVQHVFIVFCKFGGSPEIRWKSYAECLDRARSTHKPRFDVRMDLGTGQGFLNEVGMSLDQFQGLSEYEILRIVRQHAIDNPRSGKPVWWIPETWPKESGKDTAKK